MFHRLTKRIAAATSRRRLLAATTALVAAAVLSGCNVTFGATKGITTQAHEEFRLWYGMAIAGILVALIVWGLIFWAIFRYRRKDERIPKQTQEHVPLEITYTIIPIIMVIIIFAFTVITENFVDANPAPTGAVVNITAYQWGWAFQYAHTDGVTVSTAERAGPTLLPKSYFASIYPTLTLPVDETTRIFLRSQDVVHGFYVHSFNFSRYAQPGVTNEFSFTPTQTGWFPGQCTQYCGLYHSEMLFNVHVVTDSQYKTWLANAEKNPHALTGASSQPTRPGPQ
jgi:cytochrome c oxidase subunit 2